MNLKKLLISGIISTSILTGSIGSVYAENLSFRVQPNDTFWIISNKFGISQDSLLKANKANKNSILYPGQLIAVPIESSTRPLHIVKWMVKPTGP